MMLHTSRTREERLATLKGNLDASCKKLDDYMHKINLLPEDEEYISGCAELLIVFAFEYGRMYDEVFPGLFPKDTITTYFSQKSIDVLLHKE